MLKLKCLKKSSSKTVPPEYAMFKKLFRELLQLLKKVSIPNSTLEVNLLQGLLTHMADYKKALVSGMDCLPHLFLQFLPSSR